MNDAKFRHYRYFRKGHIYRVEDLLNGDGHYIHASSATSAITLVAIALNRDRDAFRVVSKLNPATHKLEHRYK